MKKKMTLINNERRSFFSSFLSYVLLYIHMYVLFHMYKFIDLYVHRIIILDVYDKYILFINDIYMKYISINDIFDIVEEKKNN